jgi:hypothetical protein
MKAAVGRILHRSSLPYAAFPTGLGGASISDQFLYRGDIDATRFVAENTLALLRGEPVEVVHRLRFFDSRGRHRHDHEIRTDRYFQAIDLSPLKQSLPELEFATFIHSSFYESASEPELARMHRGYCQYRKTPESVWSSVHGNFGGIVTRPGERPDQHRLLARRRGVFLYTPQYRFDPATRATLYFMNACRSAETVEVLLTPEQPEAPSRPHARLRIEPLGVERCVVEGHSGYLSLRSQLPMCRPQVFIEDERQPQHLDVFHT